MQCLLVNYELHIPMWMDLTSLILRWQKWQKNILWSFKGFVCGSAGKESPNARDLGSIPGSGKSPGEGNYYPLQYSCLENSMDRGAWQATVHGVTKSQKQLSNFHFHEALKHAKKKKKLTIAWGHNIYNKYNFGNDKHQIQNSGYLWKKEGLPRQW